MVTTMEAKVSLNLIKHWQELCTDITFVDIAPLLIQNRIITPGEYENIRSQSGKEEIESFLLILLKKEESILLKFVEVLEIDYSWLAEMIRARCEPEQGRDETDATPIMQAHIMDPRERLENDTSTDEERGSNMTAITLNNSLNNRLSNGGGKWRNRKPIRSRVRNRLRRKVPYAETVISSSTDLMKQQRRKEEITDEVMTTLRRYPLLSKSWTTIAHSLGLTDRVNEIRIRVIVYNEDWDMCLVYLIKAWKDMFPKKATLSRLIDVLRAENFNQVAEVTGEAPPRRAPGSTPSGKTNISTSRSRLISGCSKEKNLDKADA